MVEAESLVGDRHPQDSAVPEDPLGLLQEADRVGDVLHVVRGEDPVEAAGFAILRSGQIGDIAGGADEVDVLDVRLHLAGNVRIGRRPLPQRRRVENVERRGAVAGRLRGDRIEPGGDLENLVVSRDVLPEESEAIHMVIPWG